MDYTGIQQNPNPNPNTNSDASHSSLNTPNHSTTYLNSNLYGQTYYIGNDPKNAQPLPPGVDPQYVPSPVTVTVTYMPQSNFYEQFGATPAAGVTVPNPAIQSHESNNLKKGPKKLKIAQTAWCEICNIECNSRDVLDQHKLGKKHKRNFEKLKVATTNIPVPAIATAPPPVAATYPANADTYPSIPAAAPAMPAASLVIVAASPAIATASPAIVATSIPLSDSTSVPIDKPIVGPEDNPDKANLSKAKKARKKRAAALIEDLDTKRRKALEGGTAADALRTCTICNVVCNSETVFNYHLVGQRHAATLKKHTSKEEVASAV
ncbi:hypothetical protein ACJIZ3_002021 [Penstemon smallii]|uniref:Zinc finger protein n=1 Tax=Penstemon smallii TaxID=265156 RepID=A0ABD3U816_9LAMI